MPYARQLARYVASSRELSMDHDDQVNLEELADSQRRREAARVASEDTAIVVKPVQTPAVGEKKQTLWVRHAKK